MSSLNTPNESDENPFEASGGSSDAEATVSADLEPQMPPVESSYWIGVAVIGVLGALGLLSLLGEPSFLAFSVFGILISAVCNFAMSLWVFLPFALIRLALHRGNIARAIELGTYPGTQRFGLWYLVVSIFVSWFCMIAGGILFFGLCTVVFMTFYNELNLNGFEGVLLGLDGLLSLLFAGFVLKQGIPKYQ